MLAEHCIDIQGAPDVTCRINRSDFDDCPVVGRIELAHVIGRGREHWRIRKRIPRDTATEIIDFSCQPLFIAFIVLHALGALFHHFKLKDETLRRMFVPK